MLTSKWIMNMYPFLTVFHRVKWRMLPRDMWLQGTLYLKILESFEISFKLNYCISFCPSLKYCNLWYSLRFPRALVLLWHRLYHLLPLKDRFALYSFSFEVNISFSLKGRKWSRLLKMHKYSKILIGKISFILQSQ